MSFSYDAGKFHAGAFLSFRDEAGDDNTDIGVGGRFYWHVHSTPLSDFSFGGNLGVLFDNEPGAARDIVILNAGAGLYAANVADSILSGIALARTAIESGAARKKLAQLVEASCRA